MKKIATLFLLFFFHFSNSFAQIDDLSIGIEVLPELYFQANDQESGLFDNETSIDGKTTVGLRLDAAYDRLGFGIGINYGTLGFSKSNADTASGNLFNFFGGFGPRKTYLYQELDYRISFIEVPLRLYYKLDVSGASFNFGLTYSLHFQSSSRLKSASIYAYNINENDISLNPTTAQALLEDGGVNRFLSFSPYFEVALPINEHFSIHTKSGMRILTKSYHQLVKRRPDSLFLGMALTYKLI